MNTDLRHIAFLLVIITLAMVASRDAAGYQKDSNTTQPTQQETVDIDYLESRFVVSLFALSLTWAVIATNLFVLPFFKKNEELHKDYWTSGKVNAALGAIESTKITPALISIFANAIEGQEDKRRRPEKELTDLLTVVDFHDDIASIHNAVIESNRITAKYHSLRTNASRLWRFGLANVVLTPILPTVYVFLTHPFPDYTWILYAIGTIWSSILIIGFCLLLYFETSMSEFTNFLEEVTIDDN